MALFWFALPIWAFLYVHYLSTTQTDICSATVYVNDICSATVYVNDICSATVATVYVNDICSATVATVYVNDICSATVYVNDKLSDDEIPYL